ncbi:MAG TPA: putative porin [Candidatus Methylacidiphilales bacterium]|nr:putative porin [Candidatus Methylacidiphilales bacterium]
MNTKLSFVGLAALCAASTVPFQQAHAQAADSALLNALVKKGVLSDQEAQQIEAEDQKEYNETAASKISLASSIKSITVYGDLRLRYELRDGTTPAGYTGVGGAHLASADSQDLNRWRYRLRVGIKGTLYDNFFWGIRGATNPYYDRSGNVNFGASDSAGPFGKSRSFLGIDQVYLGWHPADDFTLIGGQMPNPLYTTNLIWSDDLNPAGAAEQWDHTFSNDFEVFATAGQFVYQAAAGNGVTNGLGGNSSNYTTFMYAEQVGFKYNFDKNTFFKGGATMYTYSGTVGSASATTVAGLYSGAPNVENANGQNSPSFFNGPFVGAASPFTSNVTGINDLAVLETPMEFDFKIGPGVTTTHSGDPKDFKSMETTTTGWVLPMRIFADFAYNFEADERADDARDAVTTMLNTGSSNTGVTSQAAGAQNAANRNMVASPAFQGVLSSGKEFLDQSAYQIGIEAGQLKKKGDWDAKLWWQSTGYYAVDPNLIDADIFNAATNLQGVVVSVSHNWTDGLSSTLRYAHAMPVNGRLATPNVNQDLQLGDIRQYNLFQADLMWKF